MWKETSAKAHVAIDGVGFWTRAIIWQMMTTVPINMCFMDIFSNSEWLAQTSTHDKGNIVFYRLRSLLLESLLWLVDDEKERWADLCAGRGEVYQNERKVLGYRIDLKKGIKKEFSIARTLQQNGVAERINRTLIKAARTMLADSKLPTTFWAEAVNTACYVQNSVLVVKHHKKTPYELFRGKFNGKSDEGFFIRYSLNSKAFRVYNIRIRKVEKNLHVRFLEDKNIIAVTNSNDSVEVDMSNHYKPQSSLLLQIQRSIKDHLLDHVIGDVQSGVLIRRMTKTINEQGFISVVYEGKTHKDLHTCSVCLFPILGRAQKGYHAVPPPYTGNFMPPKPDLVLADEDEYVFSESVTSVPDIATSKAKTSESKPKSVSEPLIEDWISDSEDENETEPKSKQRKSSFAKVEFVKSNEHVKSPRESVKKVENNKQAKYPRKNSQSPRGNQRNWNNLMTQKLGSNFEFKNKACYVCGSFNHLIKDCDFYEKKMAEKPVWNNAKRVNHQNSQRMTHPHPKRNFVPRAVLMKSGLKTLNTAGQNSSRAAVSVNTARPINTAYPRPTVNCARPASNVFNRAHSHVRRPFNKFTTNKNSNFNERVNTVRGNVTTVGPKAVVSDNKGNEANVVKASACWGNPQLELHEKGIIDNGCSRHMTGNMSYLSNYEEIDGGYVAFRGDPKGGTKACDNAGKARVETIPGKDYILLPFLTQDPLFSSSTKDSCDAGFKPSREEEKKDVEAPKNEDSELLNTEEPRVNQEKDENVNSTNNINIVSSTVNTASIEDNVVDENIVYGCADDPNMPNLEEIDYSNDDEGVGVEADMNNLDTFMPVSPIPTTRIHKYHAVEQIIRDIHSTPQTRRMTKSVTEHGYTQEEGIDYDEVFAPVARIEAIRLFLAYASFKDFVVYQMDVKSAFLYGKIEEEVYVCQPPGFEDPEFPDRVYKVEKALYGLHQAPRAWYETLSTYLLDNGFQRGQIDKTLFIKRVKSDILLVQVYVDDIIFGSTKKELCTEFEKLMHKKFQMSSMGELTFFLGLQVTQKDDGIFISQDKYVDEILKKFGFSTVKTASTPMETSKPLMKDENAEDVDVHLYRSMIGSLMYLTSSRPDIMFVVCACARFQVTPKVSHLHAVKRIFRYLKGQPKLGLWYPKDSPFVLEAYTDSDYAGASLDRKSTTGGCQFLGRRLISWQCKKQTVVANSTTEAEYVAASNCCGQVLWIQNQLLDYGYNFMNTKIFIDNESTICIVKNPVFHSKTKHIEIRHHFIRDSNEKKLIQMIKIHTDQNVADLLTKAFDVSRFQYLIASIRMLNL
ncbi:putative ribonuclease H-like domain-containing protein [Tanacetum coccineum]